MKKKLLVLLVTVCVFLFSMGGISAFAFVSLEECDKCFRTTMNSILDADEVEGNRIYSLRKPVYDLTLEQLGYVYEFEIASGKGYAIIICDDGNYVAQEVLPHTESPYATVGGDELCVFVNSMSYYKAVDGAICEISTGAQISAAAFDILMENAVFYKNDTPKDPEYETVVVNFVGTPVDDTYQMSYRPPQFYRPGLTGGCAAIAGGNLIGYFDRYYEDLIPNHIAGEFKVADKYYYNFEDNYVYQAIDQLYEDMGGSSNGINETGFKNGLKTYCSRKGLSCDFTSLLNWLGKLNYSSVKTNMQNNKPVALLLSTYNNCEIYNYDDKDIYDYTKFFGNHVMVGFGYWDITYTLSNNGTSNSRFIYVATGFGDPSDAFFNIDYSTNIVSAYAVNIH